MGTSPEGESFNTDGEGDVFYQGRTDFGFRFPTIRLFTTEGKRYAKAGDVLMSVRAPVGDVNLAKEDCAIGRGLASIRPKDGCYSFLYYTMQELNFELKKFNDEGTVFGSITKDDLFALKIVPLDGQKRKEFESVVAPIDALIKANEYEIFHLQDVCSTMLSRLTH
jgi:type I restriction enzyme S subunit